MCWKYPPAQRSPFAVTASERTSFELVMLSTPDPTAAQVPV